MQHYHWILACLYGNAARKICYNKLLRSRPSDVDPFQNTQGEPIMLFTSYPAKNYLAAAVAVCLLQGFATSVPVFAEAASGEGTVTEGNVTTQKTEASQAQTGDAAQIKAKNNGNKSSVRSDDTEDYAPSADHSAESKPIRNEFLK